MIWDVKLEDSIEFFDRTLSYELTGYRPIDQTNGLDFDIAWFTEASRRYKKLGKYCEFSQGSKRYVDFWKEEIRRFREGYEVNGYKLTGDNYFFINYYRLIDPITLEENFPTFTNVHYEWFHYVDMCEKLQRDCIALKARGVGFSEIAASMCVCPYTAFRDRRIVCTAFADNFVQPLLNKCWLQLDFLNLDTGGGLKQLRQVKNSEDWKRASMKTKDGEEYGSMSEIRGIVANRARNIRGERVKRLFYEESGSNPIMTTSWVQGEALITRAGRRSGCRFAWGTGR